MTLISWISSKRAAHGPDFIDKDARPPNSPDLNPLITMFGLNAGQIQPSERTTEEYPGAEDSASDDIGWAAARSYQKINCQLPQASARLHQRKRWTLWI